LKGTDPVEKLHKAMEKLHDDVNELTAAAAQHAEMRRQKNMLNTLLNNMPLAIFAKDAQNGYRWLMINTMAEKMFCLKNADVIGHVDSDFFPKEEADFFRSTDEKVMAGGQLVDIDAESVTTPFGTLTAHTLKVPIFDENGKPSILLGIMEDVTENFRVQDELRIAKEQAEHANQAKSEFLANMSHEIRTPMNGIIGLTRLLAETDLDRNQEQSVRAIVNSSESLLFLLNDILDFSKIEAGELTLEEAPFNLKGSLQNVIDLLSPLASKKGLVINYRYANDAPESIIGDQIRISQILINLVGNALKFTDKGHVTLSVSVKEQKNPQEYLYSFLVEDTGVGIPSEMQSQLFRKFSQGDASTTRKYGGTGLGLAISKSLIEMMGGKVSFTSQPGQGTAFTTMISLRKAVTEIVWDHKIRTNLQRQQTVKDFARYRILVADDHPVNMLFAVKLLRKMGFTRIDEATNGIEVLKKQEGAETGYDLVLMDCQMPEMDGFEACRKIREKEQKEGRKRVPVIAMTAQAMKGDRNTCLLAGMDDYVSKPVNPDKLHDVLSRWLIGDKNGDNDSRAETAAVATTDEEAPVDLSHLELFTEGDLDQEKLLGDLFFKVGEHSLSILRKHISGNNTTNDRKAAAHKFKGSAAQIGANVLSALCLKEEKEDQLSNDDRRLLLCGIAEEFDNVKAFFAQRQSSRP
jgi:PAS domain S-box-containing protein